MSVYCVYNNVDDAVYIGSTTESLRTRLSKHRSNSKRSNTKFCRHMREIGVDEFYIELLETTEHNLLFTEGIWQDIFRDAGYTILNEVRARGLPRTELCKLWRETHPEYRLAYGSERVPCEVCGFVERRDNMSKHRRRMHPDML